MFSKIALLRLLVAQDETEAPPVELPPIFGPYTEETAEKYEIEAGLSMVWISFKTEVYAKYYYNGDSKKEMAETDATSVSSVFGPRMTKLAEEIEAAVGKKYYIVFFDSKEYKDHAVEGLNCKVDADTCISVLKPMGAPESEEDEVVYTRALPAGQDLSETDESQMTFIVDFVKLIESDGTEKDQYKFTPSFSDDDESGDAAAPPEDEGFGSDEEEV